MRFLPTTSRRAIAEALLAMAVVAFVVYDLGGRSSKSESQNVVLSFEGKESSDVSRFETTVASSISSADQFTVCGDTNVPYPTIVVGNTTNQAVNIQLGGSCPSSLRITFVDPTTNATAPANGVINSGSWIVFTAVSASCSLTTTCTTMGAFIGSLSLASGSNFEVDFLNPTTSVNGVVTFALLHTLGSCSSTSGVNFVINNCPTNPGWSLVGQYVCQVIQGTASINGVTYCNYFATISGLTQASETVYLLLSKDCGTFTVDNFIVIVATGTGIPKEAQRIVAWQCSSVTVGLQILGTTAATTAAALAAFLAAVAPGGVLSGPLGVLSVSLGTPAALAATDPTITVTIAGPTKGAYGVPFCDYYPCPTLPPWNPSRSNPALLALLTLLVIPVAIFVGLLIRCCLPRAPCCEPMPVCPAAPACPPVYYAEPYACPCPDPCYQEAAPAYCTPSPTPAVTSL